MDKLSHAAREMIGAAREEARPSLEDRRRVRAAVERSVAAGRSPQWVGPPPAESRGVAPIAIAAVVLAAAAALAWMAWGSSDLLSPSAPPPPDDAALYGAHPDDPDARAEIRTSGAKARRGSASRDDAPEPASPDEGELEGATAEGEDPQGDAPDASAADGLPEGVPPSDDAGTDGTDDGRRGGKGSASRKGRRSGASDVNAELDLLRPARAAMDQGRHAEVLRLVREYRRTFPRGAFKQEAAALRVLAMCRSGRRGAAKKAAKFLKRYPTSLTAPRIRKACE